MKENKNKVKFQIQCYNCGDYENYTSKKETYDKLCKKCKVKKQEYKENRNKEIEEERIKEENIKKSREKNQSELLKSKFDGVKLNYKFELFNINSKSLSKFACLNNRRRLSTTQIKNIYQSLAEKRHFDSPIVVNKKNDLYWIIDGNHRLESIKEVLDRYKEYQIDILLIVYNNLDKDEEIQAFRTWNTGKVQSTDDFIQSISKDIDFIRWLKDEFPLEVSIYKNSKTINVRLLCGALLSAKNKIKTGYALKRSNFAKELNDLTEEDYKFLCEYIEQYKDMFGDPKIKNPYYRGCFFNAFMYVYYNGKNGKNTIFDKARDKILGNSEIIEHSQFGGKEATAKMVNLLHDKLKLKAL